MFSSVTFLVILLLTLPVFLVFRPAKYHYTLALLVAGIALTTAWSLSVLTGAEQVKEIALFTPRCRQPVCAGY